MDIKVKQRLIGALVVGALAIIFLPMLVVGPESERPADAADVPLDMPDAPSAAEAGFVTREIPLQAPADPAAAPVAGAAEPDALPMVDASATAAPRVDALPTASTEPAAAVDAATGETVVIRPTPEDTAPATAGAPAVGTAAPAAPAPQPAPTAAPAASPAPAPMAATAADGDFVVNVGSFGNRAAAEALLAKLKAAGQPAYGEAITVNGQAVTRVRVGPFADRAAAEAARLRAGSVAGTTASVVTAGDERATRTVSTAAAPTTRTAPQPVAAPSVGFAVQLGAFASEAEANALIARARAAGFVAFSQAVPTASGQLWRVRLGPEADRAAAERLQADAATRLGLRGNVVRHP
jgi:DedD protein